MKVLVLCLSHGYGGLELYVYREIRFLRSQGITCLPVISEKSLLAQKLRDDEIDFYVINSVNKHLPVFSAIRLARLIKQNQIDLLHISWGKDLNLAAMGKYFSGDRVKLVYSRHMEITRSKKDLLHRWFYKQIDKFLAISTMVEENALAFLPLSRQCIELLYLGVAAPEKEEVDCKSFFAEHGIKKRSMNIALFGRIEEGKAQHVMLSALKMFIDQKYDVSLAIIGHVMNKHYHSRLLQTVETTNMNDYVYFTGMIENAINKMPCFDVIVLTTPKETFGLVLAEAMRAGVAVIGTNAGGVVDIIDSETNGLLFEPNKPESLSESLRKLYDNPELRKRIAIEGKKKADTVFSEEHHFKQLLSHFAVLCSQKNAA